MSNIFSGFDAAALAEAFGVEIETAVKLQQESTKQGTLLSAVQDLVGLPPIHIWYTEIKTGMFTARNINKSRLRAASYSTPAGNNGPLGEGAFKCLH